MKFAKIYKKEMKKETINESYATNEFSKKNSKNEDKELKTESKKRVLPSSYVKYEKYIPDYRQQVTILESDFNTSKSSKTNNNKTGSPVAKRIEEDIEFSNRLKKQYEINKSIRERNKKLNEKHV